MPDSIIALKIKNENFGRCQSWSIVEWDSGKGLGRKYRSYHRWLPLKCDIDIWQAPSQLARVLGIAPRCETTHAIRVDFSNTQTKPGVILLHGLKRLTVTSLVTTRNHRQEAILNRKLIWMSNLPNPLIQAQTWIYSEVMIHAKSIPHSRLAYHICLALSVEKKKHFE